MRFSNTLREVFEKAGDGMGRANGECVEGEVLIKYFNGLFIISLSGHKHQLKLYLSSREFVEF